MHDRSLRSLDHAARLIGDRWSILIIGALEGGDLRYGELTAEIAGISTNMLARRLDALLTAGLLIAEPYTLRPPRMRYSLTADGRRLAPALAALTAWAGARATPAEDLEPRHVACGTPLVVRWHCPTCGVDAELDPQSGEAAIGLDGIAPFRA